MKYKQRNWLPFEEARAFVHTLSLKNNSDWQGFIEMGELPPNIPKTPQIVYKDKGWNGLGDWLGTGVIQTNKREYLSFKKARKIVRSLKLKSSGEWNKYCKSGLKPINIPVAPNFVYQKQGWAGFQDWIGIEPSLRNKKDYLPYEQAKEFVHTLRIKTLQAWRDYCKSGKKPPNIPTYPNLTYKENDWLHWKDWLGPR